MASCSICRDLKLQYIQEWHDDYETDQWIAPDQLKESANEGCSKCAVLHDFLCQFDVNWKDGGEGDPQISGMGCFLDMESTMWLPQIYTYRDTGKGRTVPNTLHLEMFLDGAVQFIADCLLHYCISHVSLHSHIYFLASRASLTLYQALPLISGDTESILATEKATQWLHECLTTHDFCQYPDHASLPTRVVDLLPWKTKKDPILVDSKSLSISDNSTAYVCLSHCWGKAALIRTTKATIEHHKGGIPWTLLSKTFQDAIKITLDLGVRYIWIDSLCIIQDDETDWQVQAGQMASIYENCLFTIAATASADGSGGCYRKAPAEYAQVVTRSRTNREGRNFTASCRRAIQHPDTLIHAPDGYMVHAPLIDRAWVFQEHELSRRVLQFTATELMWECNSSLRCECGRVQPDRYQRKSQLVQARTAEELAFLGNEWRKRVVAYSCRMLTYGTDKLPALSGVAKQMQRHMSSVSTVRYLAGLWEHDLLEALTWISGTNPGGQNIAAYRAPSWSWASLEGILDYDDTYELNMNRSVARILEVHCVPAGLDPTGAVSGGCLKIAGPLIEVNLEYNPNENYDPREIRYHVTYGTYNDNRPQINPDYPYAEAGDLYMPSGETVFCLRLGSIRFKDRSGRLPDDNYKALLLRRSAKVQGSFERIGLFRNFGEDTAEGWFDDAPSVTVIIV